MRYASLLALGGASLLTLSACSNHLPKLETAPGGTLKVQDLVSHISCELASVANRKENNPQARYNHALEARIASETYRPGATPIEQLIPYLADYHFVANVSLTLDVTDNEGLNPSLSFINPYNAAGSFNSALSVGAQYSGYQNRSITFSYNVDFDRLEDKNWQDKFCQFDNGNHSGNSDEHANAAGGISGDLGLSDIIVDGLTELDATRDYNINKATSQTVSIDGSVAGLGELVGEFSLGSPQQAGSPPDGPKFSANFFEPNKGAPKSTYDIDLLGKRVAGNPNRSEQALKHANYQFSGNMTRGEGSKPISITLYKGEGDAYLAQVTVGDKEESGAEPMNAAKGPTPAKPPGSQTGSGAVSTISGGVSFDVVLGLGVGPNWTILRFKGPSGSASGAGSSGSGQFLTADRENTDTLTITFAPGCRGHNIPQPTPNFWSTLPKDCGAGVDAARLAVGAQNTSAVLTQTLSRLRTPP